MRNLVKVLSVLAISVVAAIALSGVVNAGDLFFDTPMNTADNNNTTNNAAAENNTAVENNTTLLGNQSIGTANEVKNNTVVNKVVNETVIPKTGENDTAIVLGVGAVVLVVGGVAYARSRKYNV